MTKTNDRREFLLKSASAAAVVASSAALSACGESPLTPAEYRYGVASGDPLTDRVILWTHAKSIDSNLSIPLTYEVATDSAFSTIVKSGSCLTSQETGFTTKVDVTGLSAGTSYQFDLLGASAGGGVTATIEAQGQNATTLQAAASPAIMIVQAV